MNTKKQIRADRVLLESLGGPAQVCELLDYDKKGGIQRVQNWMTRGIPSRVKLDYPKIFLPIPSREEPGRRDRRNPPATS